MQRSMKALLSTGIAGAALVALIFYGLSRPAQLPEPHRSRLSGSRPTPQREIWVGVFRPFPGSRMLCQQHVTGAGVAAPRIVWALYATDRLPSEVRDFYAGHLGKETAEAPAEVQLRVGKKLLVAYAASSNVYPRCGVEPKTTDKTAIVVSELISSDQ